MPELKVLMHTFPALDRSLTLLIPDDCHRSRIDEIEWFDVHSRNAAAQPDEGKLAPWKRIDRLICDSQLLYLLALKCPIGHTYLLMGDRSYARKTRDYFVSGLRESRPVRLTLDMLYIESTSDLRFFNGIFPEELGSSLTHLAFGLQYVEPHLGFHTEFGTRQEYRLWSPFVVNICDRIR